MLIFLPKISLKLAIFEVNLQITFIHVISPDLVGFSRFWASQPDCPPTSPVGPKSPDFSICLSQFFGNVPFLILR